MVSRYPNAIMPPIYENSPSASWETDGLCESMETVRYREARHLMKYQTSNATSAMGSSRTNEIIRI